MKTSSVKTQPLHRLRAFWRRRRGQILEALFCLIAAIGFVLIFSESTSPLYSDYYNYGGIGDYGDSLQFQTVGKGWAEGLIPYRDLFDHKGPLAFLVNALGFLIGFGSRYGIVVFQIIALFVVLEFIFKFAALVSKRRVWGVISSLIFLIYYTYCYVCGNSVQEYNLPFIMAACYYAVKFLAGPTTKAKHPPKYAFLYGICAGACLMIQATNAILVAALVLVIGIVLLYRRHFVNLWQNIAAGLAGILIVVVPFVVYFAANGALADMIYTVFLYNLEYADHMPSWLNGASGYSVTFFILRFLPYVILPVVIFLAYRRGQKAYAGALTIAFIIETCFFLSMRAYYQYTIPVLPQIILLLNELLIWRRTLQRRTFAPELRFVWVGVVTVISMLCYNITMDRISNRVDVFQAVRAAGATTEYDAGYEELMETYVLAQDENGAAICSSFTAIGHDYLKGIYLRYNLLPNNRYFTIQRWHTLYSDTIAAYITAEFNENNPDCVLVDPNPGNTDLSLYQSTLDEKYVVLGENDDYMLYKLKSDDEVE